MNFPAHQAAPGTLSRLAARAEQPVVKNKHLKQSIVQYGASLPADGRDPLRSPSDRVFDPALPEGILVERAEGAAAR